MYAVKFILVAIMSINSFFLPLTEYCRDIFSGIFETVQASAEAGSPQVVMEATTGKIISSQGADEIFAAGHFAKLMTLLVAQEAVENGELSYDAKVTVSQYANSMQGTQIWLGTGEEITVEELIKSISVGNANDACVALAEATAKTEEAFVEKMNVKAQSLGMESTYYADCTGISPASVTTAGDIALLCAELVKHERLYPYMTTWIDTVRGGKTQLVNLNRLVRTYNGIIGIKACYIEDVGNCLAAAAARGDMTVIAVVIGRSDEDSRFSWARDEMNRVFAAYEMYEPQLTDGAMQDVAVLIGEKPFCKVESTDKSLLLIPKGSADRVKISYERVESVPAPIEMGTIIGSVTLTLDGEEIFTTDLCAAESVKQLSYFEALRRLLLELLKS